jgi:hypothetical protein
MLCMREITNVNLVKIINKMLIWPLQEKNLEITKVGSLKL